MFQDLLCIRLLFDDLFQFYQWHCMLELVFLLIYIILYYHCFLFIFYSIGSGYIGLIAVFNILAKCRVFTMFPTYLFLSSPSHCFLLLFYTVSFFLDNWSCFLPLQFLTIQVLHSLTLPVLFYIPDYYYYYISFCFSVNCTFYIYSSLLVIILCKCSFKPFRFFTLYYCNFSIFHLV